MSEHPTKIQAWWWHRQGLDGTMQGQKPTEILKRCGWARSVAGVGPYLTLWTRGGHSRTDIDKAVAKTQIHELPAARNCTYVVPQCDYEVALLVGKSNEQAEHRTAAKLGVTAKEVEALCQGVCKALEQGTLDPQQIRDAVGKLARSLGDEGKKKGLTTTLPLALSRLQCTGIIRRVPMEGRLDQQRYRYCLWNENPLSGSKLSSEKAYTKLAESYFSWVGPATLSEFQWFASLSMKATKQAVESLGLVPDETDSDRLMLPQDKAEFDRFRVPKAASFALVSSLDTLFAARRNVSTLLGPGDREAQVRTDRRFESLGGISDLPSHAIVDRGRLIGLWEYDLDAESIVWTPFEASYRKNKKLLDRIKEAEEFVRSELGDARSFSLDSPKSRKPRLDAMKSS
jgi:hypothetical protein